MTARQPPPAPRSPADPGPTMGFLTDPTVCIGCKACEVACKEWNGVPSQPSGRGSHGYDHTLALGASSWRHVKFVESGPGDINDPAASPLDWVFLSDVCKHCEHAGCLEACPTGSIVRLGSGAVYVQDDVCNGCGYCVVNCPFGVIDRRPQQLAGGGGAYKCTFCSDRQADGLLPACAKACPTEAIQFGELDDLRRRAAERTTALQAAGRADITLYDARAGSVGGTHALFLVPGDPRTYGLPRAPAVPTDWLAASWLSAALTAVLVMAIMAGAFAWPS